MVIGQYFAKIAENGRVAIPKKFRVSTAGKYIITQGYEGSLLIAAYQSWELLVREISAKPFLMEEARDTARFLLGNANVFVIDQQGRFIVPIYLRIYGKIKSEAVFLGLGNYIELWDLVIWKEHEKILNQKSKLLAQKLSELSLK